MQYAERARIMRDMEHVLTEYHTLRPRTDMFSTWRSLTQRTMTGAASCSCSSTARSLCLSEVKCTRYPCMCGSPAHTLPSRPSCMWPRHRTWWYAAAPASGPMGAFGCRIWMHGSASPRYAVRLTPGHLSHRVAARVPDRVSFGAARHGQAPRESSACITSARHKRCRWSAACAPAQGELCGRAARCALPTARGAGAAAQACAACCRGGARRANSHATAASKSRHRRAPSACARQTLTECGRNSGRRKPSHGAFRASMR